MHKLYFKEMVLFKILKIEGHNKDLINNKILHFKILEIK